MRGHRTALGIVGLLVLAFGMSGCLNLFGPRLGEVAGKVTWDGKAVIGALVEAGGKRAVTAVDGSFRVRDVEQGTHTLKVTVDGQVAETRSITVRRNPVTANIELASGPTELVVIRSAITEEATSLYPSYTDYLTQLTAFLVNNNYTFMILTDEDVMDGKLAGAQLAILNDQGVMRQAEVDAIWEYVQGGGKILATYSTSIRSGDDPEHPNVGFQLADVYGVRWVEWTNQPAFSKMKVVNDHPIVAGFGEEIELGGGPRHHISIVDATPIAVLVDQEGNPGDVSDSTVLVVSDYGVYASFVLLYSRYFDDPVASELIHSILEYYAPNARR